MNQPNPNTTRDFIGGLVLVPLLHFVFTLLWFGISVLLTLVFPFFNHNYNFFFLFIPIVALSLTQAIYLIPAYIHFTRKQRPEVGKGIILGAIATLLINGACFAQMGNFGNAGGTPQLLIAAIVMLITIGLIGYRLVTRR
jgi:cation transport ATPase